MEHGPPDRLVIFDVDGTLVQSVGVDDHCFAEAVHAVLGVSNISTNWADYKYQTDSGLVWELGGRQGPESVDGPEVQQVRQRFLTLLTAETNRPGFAMPAVPGAAELLNLLRSHTRWGVAIATGGWEQAARLKLKYAGLDIRDIPLASSADHFARENIIQVAIERAQRQYQQTRFGQIVYVGDGSWDLVAAHKLGIGFIGVGNFQHPADVPVVRDFVPPENFVALLDSTS